MLFKDADLMGPKTKFTREQIIDAAFDIARTEGIDGITMRKIAEKMGSSVAPIYVNFKNIDELIEAIFEKIIEISRKPCGISHITWCFYLKRTSGRLCQSAGLFMSLLPSQHL